MGNISISGVSGGSPPYTVKVYKTPSTLVLSTTVNSFPYNGSFGHLNGGEYYAVVESAGCTPFQSNNVVVDCSKIDIAYFDFIYSLGSSTAVSSGGARCSDWSNVINDMEMFIWDDNTFSPTYTQNTSPSNRFLPNGSSFNDAHVISYLDRSCGTIDSTAFFRNGFNVKKIYDAYPLENIFSYRIYARHSPSYPASTYLNFIARLNKINSCSFYQSVPGNGSDIARTGSCYALGINDVGDALPSTTTTFVHVGNVVINKSNNTITYSP